MSNIKVISGNLSDVSDTIMSKVHITELPAPTEMLSLKAPYLSALEDAAVSGEHTVYFPSIPKAEKPSTMFQAISLIYKTMTDFQSTHQSPEEIVIVCVDPEIFNLYMVVWNLYYAETKSDRMNDGRWD